MSEHFSEESTSQERERVTRLSAATPPQRADASGDDVVREYEERYYGLGKAKRQERPRSYSTLAVTEEERLWSAVAHSSIWITLVAGILSLGVLVPMTIFIPLIIYLLFRKRSDFVAFHALQALVIQLLGTVGALALFVIGGLVWGLGLVVAVLAMVVLVGFILVPLWGLVGVALLLAVCILPLAALLYGTIAAIETYHRRDYRYPFVAKWVDRQMAGGLLHIV